MTLVTVIVPVFNVEEYLDDCLASVAGQNHLELEVLLIDDGSTDSSRTIAAAWAERDPRFRVLSQDNQGSSVARNLGLDEASGEYVTFVDSDDVIDPRMVPRMLELARRADADAVILDYVDFRDAAPPFEAGDVESIDLTGIVMMTICEKPRWGTPAKLYRRHLFDGLRFPIGLKHQDLWLFPRIMSRARSAIMTSDRLYGYRQRPGSIMDQSRRVRLSTDLLTVLDDNIAFTLDDPGSGPIHDELIAAYALHASKQLERMSAAQWRRSGEFVTAYRRFAGRHWPLVRSSSVIGWPYRSLWRISMYWPFAFWVLSRSALVLKRRLLRGLRRRSTRAAASVDH